MTGQFDFVKKQYTLERHTLQLWLPQEIKLLKPTVFSEVCLLINDTAVHSLNDTAVHSPRKANKNIAAVADDGKWRRRSNLNYYFFPTLS